MRGSSSRGAREGLLGLKQRDRERRPGDFYRRWAARADLPNQDGAHQAGADDRRAHRRISPGAGARLDDAIVGPLPGAQAVHAHRGELGAVDARACAILRAEGFEPKREELNAAIERARLRALEHFGKARP